MKSHYIIPIFTPELACPFQCVYCNQKSISCLEDVPTEEKIRETIEKHLSTIDICKSTVEIAYFGGNFTGIDSKLQTKFLKIANEYINKYSLEGIRISTRPDYINNEKLSVLVDNNVKVIELGSQSLCDDVLRISGRGHKVDDVVKASEIILKKNVQLGLQMMIGLPGDTYEKSKVTAEKIIGLGAHNTRIYPTLVVKETLLEKWYNEGKYKPLELSEAVNWVKDIYTAFEKSNVSILRVGLHPSEGLINKYNLIAGPFHQSFRELVLTELWYDELNMVKPIGDNIIITVPADQINYAIGYKSKNKNLLSNRFKKVKFIKDNMLNNREFNVSYY